jgi:hypothetical protein
MPIPATDPLTTPASIPPRIRLLILLLVPAHTLLTTGKIRDPIFKDTATLVKFDARPESMVAASPRVRLPDYGNAIRPA